MPQTPSLTNKERCEPSWSLRAQTLQLKRIPGLVWLCLVLPIADRSECEPKGLNALPSQLCCGLHSSSISPAKQSIYSSKVGSEGGREREFQEKPELNPNSSHPYPRDCGNRFICLHNVSFRHSTCSDFSRPICHGESSSAYGAKRRLPCRQPLSRCFRRLKLCLSFLFLLSPPRT